MSGISDACHTQRPIFRLFAHTLRAHFRYFWHRTHSSSSWFSDNRPVQYKLSASTSSSLSFPHPSSSDREETNLHGGLTNSTFSTRNGSSLLLSFCPYFVFRKEPYDSSVSYLLVDCTRLFFSNFALNGEMFDLRTARPRRSNITCFLFSN